MLQRKTGISIAGVVITGISVAMLKFAAFGVDPCQSAIFGIWGLTGMSYGTVCMIINGILAAAGLFFARRLLGISTIMIMLVQGYVIQYTYAGLMSVLDSDSIVLRMIFTLSGIVMMCFGNALYAEAGLGVSPYDWIAMHLAERSGKLSFRVCRIIVDASSVSLAVMLFSAANGGFMLPEVTGAVTIILALATGPLIDLFRKTLRRSMQPRYDGIERHITYQRIRNQNKTPDTDISQQLE